MRLAHAAILALASPASFAAVPGFTADYTAAGNTGTFVGGSLTISNPGTNGVGGASDGYINAFLQFAASFGCFTIQPELIGNYTASNIGGISFWLRDVGNPDNFEIHIGLGSGSANFWTFNAPFVPTADWKKFYVNLTNVNVAQWSRVHGGGSATLPLALANVTRILFRHDHAPYVTNPDPTSGDLGIDRIQLHLPCPGETNGDDVIDFGDLNNCLSNFGASGINLPGDVNNSGNVDFADLNIILSNFGHVC